MDKLINFIHETYPTIHKKQIYTSLLNHTPEYATIAISKNQTLNMMDKVIYKSSKGNYIRVLTKPNRYMRVYMEEFK